MRVKELRDFLTEKLDWAPMGLEFEGKTLTGILNDGQIVTRYELFYILVEFAKMLGKLEKPE